jgi:hypothetical protein
LQRFLALEGSHRGRENPGMPARITFRLLLCLSVVWLIPQNAASIRASQDISVEGEVINDLTELPIPGARVVLSPNPSTRFTTVCDSLGHFRFEGLQPDQYWVRAEKPGFMAPGDGPSRGGGGIGVRLTAGQIPGEVRVRLIPIGIISGKITDSNGLAVADSVVEVVRKLLIDARPGLPPAFQNPLSDGKNRLERMAMVLTNDLGEYRIAPLRAGTYFVSTQPSLPPPDSDKTERNTYYPHSLDLASAAPVELAAGEEAHINIQMIRQSGVRISGRTSKPAGREIGPARYVYTQVDLYSQYGDSGDFEHNHAMVNNDERFELKDVLPGMYVLEAVTRAIKSENPHAEEEVLAAAREVIEVGPSDLDGIVIPLQPLREIRGRIRFEENCQPVPLIVRALSFSRSIRRQIDAKQNADGTFILSGLVPGPYSLNIQPERMASSDFVVSSARLGSVDVFREGFDVSGEIKDSLLITVSCGAAKKAGTLPATEPR